MIGNVVNGYRILRQLGCGGMAVVYYAENNLGLPVAIKVLKPEFSNNKEVLNRFREEASIMYKLRDIDGVCNVIDLVEQPSLMIVMEYLDGMTLADFIKKSLIKDEKQIADICRMVLTALGEAHHRGIIHRDIKPSNLFLTAEGKVKILDFGISKILFGEGELGTELETETKSRIGTIAYMSPEQIKYTAKVDQRTDIYSFALTLYNMLTGEDPLNMESDSLDAVPNPRLAKAIYHAIRKKSDQRTPDCATFLREIQEALKPTSESEPNPTPIPESSPKPNPNSEPKSFLLGTIDYRKKFLRSLCWLLFSIVFMVGLNSAVYGYSESRRYDWNVKWKEHSEWEKDSENYRKCLEQLELMKQSRYDEMFIESDRIEVKSKEDKADEWF